MGEVSALAIVSVVSLVKLNHPSQSYFMKRPADDALLTCTGLVDWHFTGGGLQN